MTGTAIVRVGSRSLARKTVSFPAGQKVRVRFALTKQGRARLSRRRSTKVEVITSLRTALGQSIAETRTVTVSRKPR